MRIAALLFVLLLPTSASARRYVEVDDGPYRPPCPEAGAALFEVAPWLALGGGFRRDRDGAQHAIGALAADAAITVPVFSWFRTGIWVAPGTTDFRSFDAAGGARLELQTNPLNGEHSNFFGVGGRKTLIVDLGGGHRFGANDGPFWVVRVAFGFTAPNLLYHLYPRTCPCDANESGPCRPTVGMTAGVRPWIAVQRAFDQSYTDVTAGLSFETIGAGWWILAGL